MSYKLRITPNIGNMYEACNSYKELLNFYNDMKNLRTETELRDRMKFLLKNKVKQMNEMETLKWVLGESIIEKDFNETKDIA